MEQAVNFLNDIIWSKALICLCLGTGLWFSVGTRFLQVRHFGHMARRKRRPYTRKSALCRATRFDCGRRPALRQQCAQLGERAVVAGLGAVNEQLAVAVGDDELRDDVAEERRERRQLRGA